MHDHLSSSLTEKIEILTLVQDEETGNIAWAPSKKRWASVEIDTQRNIFSAVGVGTRGATIVIRTDHRLTLHQAIRWRGEFLHLTSIVLSKGRDRQEIKAALVTPVECLKDADKTPAGCSFPGVLTEKYVGHEQLDPLAVVTGDYVLVTPKPITLAPGSWVICDGRYYRVLVPHELDEYKNEYEIRRKEDC